MHSCPRCGQACDCSGDWDDCDVMKPEWVFKNCECDCEGMGDDDRDDDFDYDPDDDDLPEYYQCLGCNWTGDYNPGHCPRCSGYTIDGVY